jgi:hypothetical protein
MTCRGKAMHALGECDCDFKPRDFLELLAKERQWFDLLDALRELRWQRTVPEESPESLAVTLMLRHRARWLRNWCYTNHKDIGGNAVGRDIAGEVHAKKCVELDEFSPAVFAVSAAHWLGSHR